MLLARQPSTGHVVRRGGFGKQRFCARSTTVVTRSQPDDKERSVSAAPPIKAEDEDRQGSGAQASTSGSQGMGLSYKLIAGLATAGVVETAYLTAVKLTGGAPVCPISGCDSVLTSSYSEILGVPLSLLGMLAYGAVGVLAASALARNTNGQPTQTLDTALSVGAAGLAGVSGVLIYLLQTQFAGEFCLYCYASAAFSLSIFATALFGMPTRTVRQAAVPSLLGAGLGAFVLLASGLGSPDRSAAEDFELAYAAPVVTNESSPQAVALAKRLKAAGARMYGAFWCSHCFEQKQVFGKEAMSEFPYVECYPDGWKRGVKVVDACEAAGVRAFPTWVINGQTVEGELTLEALEAKLDGKEDPASAPKPKPRSPFADL